MQLGELFFNLGFKSKGFEEAEKFIKLIKEARVEVNKLNKEMGRAFTRKMGKIGWAPENKSSDSLEKTTESVEELTTALSTGSVILNGFISLGMVVKNIFIGVGKALLGVAEVAFKLGKGFMVAGAAVLYFLKSSSDIAMSIDKLSAATGVTIGKLYNMKKFAAENGVEFDSMASSLERVVGIAQDIRIGKLVPSRYYQMLQIDPMASYEKQLEQLSAALKRHPDLQQALAGARDLGFTKDDIYIAQTVSGIYEKLNKEIGKPEDHARLVKFNKEFNAFLERMRVSLGGLLLHYEPIISKILKKTEEFVDYLAKADLKDFDKLLEDFLADPLKIIKEKISEFTAFIKAQVTEIMNIIDTRMNRIFDNLEKRIDAQIEKIKSIFGMGGGQSKNENKPEKMFPSIFGKKPDGTTPIIKPTMESPLKPILEKITPILGKIRDYFNPPSTPSPTPSPTPMPTPSSRLRFPGTQINSGDKNKAPLTEAEEIQAIRDRLKEHNRKSTEGNNKKEADSIIDKIFGPNRTNKKSESYIDNNWNKDPKGEWLTQQQRLEKTYKKAKEDQKKAAEPEENAFDKIKNFLRKVKKGGKEIYEKTKDSSKEIFDFNKNSSDSNYYQPQWVPRTDRFEPDMPKPTPDSQKYINPKNKNSDMPIIFNIEINESKDPRHTADILKQTFSKTFWQLQRGER